MSFITQNTVQLTDRTSGFFGTEKKYDGMVLSIEDIYEDVKKIDEELNELGDAIQADAEKIHADAIKIADYGDRVLVAAEETSKARDEVVLYVADARGFAERAEEASNIAVTAGGRATISAGEAAGFAETASDAAQDASNFEAGAENYYNLSKDLYDDLSKGQVYRGNWNPHTGVFPDFKGTNSVWDVVLDANETEYTALGKTWRWGDRLVYVLVDSAYNQLESGIGGGVVSINGKKGAVTLSASDVGAPTISYTNTELNKKVPTTRTVNGKALSSDIALTHTDVGAAPASIVAELASSVGASKVGVEGGKTVQDAINSLQAQTGAVVSSENPPANPVADQRWFNTTDGMMYFYYQDADSAQWVEENPASGSSGVMADGIDWGVYSTTSEDIAKVTNHVIGKDGKGLDEVYVGGGWTGGQAGSGNLQGNAHTNAQKLRYDLKQNNSLDTVLWVEKESIAERGDTTSGDTGWDGGAGYFSVKKKSGSAPVNVLTGYGRHEGGASNGVIGVLGRGSGQVETSEVWGVWSYAEVGFGAKDTGVTQCIALESNTCNRGPDKGWMAGTGAGASRGVLSLTADGSNRCTHGFYTGNHKASGGLPGTGGWWTGYLVGQNSIAANTNSTTTYVGDGEAFRVNGSGRQEGKYGGFRFHKGFFNYGTSYIEGSYTNNCAILMGPGKRIVWGSHAGSSRHMDYNEETNTLSINNTALGINGTRVVGQRVLGISGLAGTADGSSKNTETMTHVELCRYVKVLSDALRTHGLIGTSTKDSDD